MGMQEILSVVFLKNTLAQWLTAAAYIIGGFIIGLLGALLTRKILEGILKKKKDKFDDQIIRALERPVALLIFLAGIIIGLHRLNLSDTVRLWSDRIINSFFIIFITSALSRTLDKIIIRAIPHQEEDHRVSAVKRSNSVGLDGARPPVKREVKFQPLVRKLTGTILWIIAFILVLKTMGINITALMAGLGLGGAALALASKDTLSNFFGSITVFFDRPFRINDRININGYDGVITEMGLRTSKLKTNQNRTVFIPNSLFSSQPIENISEQPNVKVVQTIGFKGDNGSEKIARGLEIIREVAAANPGLEGTAIAGLISISAMNCQANFIYFVSNRADYTKTVNQVNMEILRRFEEEGIRLA
ncbi:MAG: mechanosensitive ion channel family protein [Treponema sp.]|nr:mechanosensitive ion channel family protein [Treponema sp.]